MNLESPWNPRLEPGPGTVSERIAAAIAVDIAKGMLKSGDRLPPHRETSYALGVSVGTVTRGYAEAARRGLLSGSHGKATFVTDIGESRGVSFVDLSLNVPPAAVTDRQLGAALLAISHRTGTSAELGKYDSNQGRAEHRALFANWLSENRELHVSPNRINLCNGAQQALAMAFRMLRPQGGSVLTEAATFPGALTLAERFGIRLVGLAMDDEGLCPSALEAQMRLDRGGAHRPLVFVTPTLQNPTSRTMSAQRRMEIVQICQKFDADIIEDDVYGALYGQKVPALAELAPDRVFFITSFSKILSPGLRIGMLVCPETYIDEVSREIRATTWCASPIACLVTSEYLVNGTAKAALKTLRYEATLRNSIATKWLGTHIKAHLAPSFHVWIEMPAVESERLTREALESGIRITPPSSCIVDPRYACGVRVCLGAAKDHVELDYSLKKLSELIGKYEAQTAVSPGAGRPGPNRWPRGKA